MTTPTPTHHTETPTQAREAYVRLDTLIRNELSYDRHGRTSIASEWFDALRAVLDLPPCAGPDDLYEQGYNAALTAVQTTIADKLGITLSPAPEPSVN